MPTKQPLDFLRLEGIYKKGYGIIPKFIMHDLELSLESKAIYAYLCALSGSGNQTFPYRETILKHLKLAKNTYYSHYKPLIEQGYITVERPSDKTAANIYTLISNPKKLLEVIPEGDGILSYSGIKSHGYGSIPRSVMLDTRLSIKSKGLYAYFCSYCGAGKSAFPRKAHILHHLGISEPTYYKALNQLKKYNYIQIKQRKISGMFSINDYYLNEFPDVLDTPNQKNCDTINCDVILKTNSNINFSPNQKNCDLKSKDIKLCDTKDKDSFIITNTYKNKNINSSKVKRSNKKRTSRKSSYDLSEIESIIHAGDS